MHNLENNIQIDNGQYDNLIWSIVHKILTKINDRYYYIGLEDDLFQEGYMALIIALDKYDNNKNIQFSTFAYKYIYGYCLNYLKKECKSLNNEDIDSSPILSNCFYELDSYFKIDLIDEINNRLKIIDKKVPQSEEKILKDRLYNGYSLQKCAELNDCSIKKISNVINKYKDLIKEIIIQGGF